MTRLAASFALLACLAFVAGIAGCGGGGVSGPAVTTGALAISPATTTVFSDVPARFVVTGGTAPYFITSSNGAVLPVPSGAYNYNELTLIPNSVGADTSVTISATDAKNSTSVSSTVTVRPRTISNVVTITPNPSQAASCGSSVCAGGDATVSVKLSQAGAPLAGRRVRFDVVSGPISIIASATGNTETLAPTGEAITDATGTATIRVRAGQTSVPVTALLDATDEVSGATVRTGISVSPAANVPLAVTPTTIVFQGSTANTCASNTSADVIVFGGQPPYSVSQPAGFFVSPAVVTSNPGRFTVTATGTCSNGSTVGIVDALGSSATVTVTNTLSQTPAVVLPAFSVAPDTVTLATCTDAATVAMAGGTGNYYGAGGSDLIDVRPISSQSFQIQRRANTAGPGGTTTVTVNAGFSDGQSTATVKVNLIGAALGAC